MLDKTKNISCYLEINDDHSYQYACLLKNYVSISVIQSSIDFVDQCKLTFPNSYVFYPYDILDASLESLNKRLKCLQSNGLSYILAQEFISSHYLILTHLYSRSLENQSKSTIDKDIYFYKLYQFCEVLVNHYALNLFLSLNEPHQVHDYILQEIVSSSGGTCLNFMKTFSLGHIIIRDPIHNVTLKNVGPESLRLQYNNISEILLSKTGNRQIYDVRTSDRIKHYSADPLINFPFYLFKAFLLELKSFTAKTKNAIILLLIQDHSKSLTNFLKALSTILTEFSLSLNRFFLRVNSGYSYSKQCKYVLDYSEILANRYILMPLQCTPERQSIPSGLPCFSQSHLIDYLSHVADTSKIQVLLKEHPSQHKLFQRNFLGRTQAFYDHNLLLDNTLLIPSYFDSYRLIDNSSFVIGIGGSICWESILRGKPTFIVGKPWYIDIELPNKYDDKNYNDLSDLIRVKLDETDTHYDVNYIHNTVASWLINHLFTFPLYHEKFELTDDQKSASLKHICETVLEYALQN